MKLLVGTLFLALYFVQADISRELKGKGKGKQTKETKKSKDGPNANPDYRMRVNNEASVFNINLGSISLSNPLGDDANSNAKEYKRYEITGWGPQYAEIDGLHVVLVNSKDEISAQYNVVYCNNLTVPVSMHQHGLTPPNNQDGVPMLSQPPIQPGRCDRVHFDILPKNFGTHFIHSHYSWQHERGLSLPLIVRGPPPPTYPDPYLSVLRQAKDHVLFLEDSVSFFGEGDLDGETGYPITNVNGWNQSQVMQLLSDGWREDKSSFNFSECMDAGDGFDVAFRYHLANGRQMSDPIVMFVERGEYIRLRVINDAAMSSYVVQFNSTSWGKEMPRPTLIAVDGQFTEPHFVDEFDGLWVGPAQRGDVLLQAPEEDVCFPIFARNAMGPLDQLPPSDILFNVKRQQAGVLMCVGEATPSSQQKFGDLSEFEEATGFFSQDNTGMGQERSLRAFFPLTDEPPDYDIVLDLTGDNGFQSIDNQTLPFLFYPANANSNFSNPHPLLLVESNKRVCITIVNYNADAHAMHLHGHSFQVVSIDNENFSGAMRDTFMTGKGECHEAKICFDTDNEGVWPLHCHMTYHAMAGMVTTIEYKPAESNLEPSLLRWYVF